MLMKRDVHILISVLLLSVVMGCTGTTEPKPDGEELLKYITDNDYKKWKLWPGKGEMFQGTEPHGALLTVYVTDNAYTVIEGKKGSMPAGGIIVKENYKPDRTLDAITVMYKVKGYDEEHNDWFWAKYSADGIIDAEGKVEGCINCHGLKKDNDYLYTGELK